MEFEFSAFARAHAPPFEILLPEQKVRTRKTGPKTQPMDTAFHIHNNLMKHPNVSIYNFMDQIQYIEQKFTDIQTTYKQG